MLDDPAYRGIARIIGQFQSPIPKRHMKNSNDIQPNGVRCWKSNGKCETWERIDARHDVHNEEPSSLCTSSTCVSLSGSTWLFYAAPQVEKSKASGEAYPSTSYECRRHGSGEEK